MKEDLSKWYRVLAPRMTVLIATINKAGVSNAAPFSFVMPASGNPPLIIFGSAPKRHTLDNIRATGDFTVNIPPASLLKQVWICADKFPEGVSEIEEVGLTEVPSHKVASPKIKECYAKFECVFKDEYEVGDHVMVVGEIVAVDVDKEVFDGEKLYLDKAQPLMHVGSVNFAKVGELLKYQR